MKTELTIEQSQRLIELGVSIDKASSESMVGGSIFTLADLLGILPKRIKKNDACLTLVAEYNDWSAAYEYYDLLCGGIDAVYSVSAPELIDALFSLTLWCIENKYIQL